MRSSPPHLKAHDCSIKCQAPVDSMKMQPLTRASLSKVPLSVRVLRRRIRLRGLHRQAVVTSVRTTTVCLALVSLSEWLNRQALRSLLVQVVLTSNLTAQIRSTIHLLILSRLWARNIRHQPRLSQRMVWKLLTQASELAKTISPSLIHLVSLVEKIRIIILRMRSQQKASSRIRRKIWVRSKVH